MFWRLLPENATRRATPLKALPFPDVRIYNDSHLSRRLTQEMYEALSRCTRYVFCRTKHRRRTQYRLFLAQHYTSKSRSFSFRINAGQPLFLTLYPGCVRHICTPGILVPRRLRYLSSNMRFGSFLAPVSQAKMKKKNTLSLVSWISISLVSLPRWASTVLCGY